MFRRPPVILVSAPSKLRTVNEVSFKQHDKRKVIGSKVNGFPLLALLAIRHRGGWRLEVTAHSQRGRFPSDVGRQTNTTIEQKLTWLEREAPRFDICLYNAGIDPFGGCSIGGMQGVTQNVLRDREVAVFSWCRMRGVPIVFVLAGDTSGWGLSARGSSRSTGSLSKRRAHAHSHFHGTDPLDLAAVCRPHSERHQHHTENGSGVWRDYRNDGITQLLGTAEPSGY
jgi:hypothetical protein